MGRLFGLHKTQPIAHAVGLLAGSMTDPPALAFASNIAGSDAPTVAYATVYPLTTLLRILSAQVPAIALFR
jgi:putative transport protein